MDGKMFARLAAVIAIAVAGTAAAIHLAREESSTTTRPSPAAAEAPRTDPLRETLRRCQQMGESATRDPQCLAAWEENRRRFLSPAAGN
ncbi:putative entry exclusion protein TrbK-alt [Mesorhizobium sp.]|uniref:putative entry exclusion protein TrbK-alt n=1 Tax=Mesorhizobium sp. TaxID=1871066 RepID=UPI000FE77DEB|nr:putative entry exclusion protein TrbK-alt [Mesorhizobium sp.]RWK65633.1 MAG: conjugal transfer protein TrbK [Mesorhizobium sp.]RWM53852.1 MAG: conjugal transfer protein TrbK [Mesorhizobium sp.]RWM60780.1 MAG: conjugal transfer protein TrbK [Mesorhizobium sp.]RWM62026.1 MAG: conjugal transfer protein TrbK [Mesorhizobium sp.]RWN03749.1 MAG: conjugal transfer protein TrbK [Mesorhizobium sp.]